MQTRNDAGAMPPASDWTGPDDAPELTDEFFAKAEHYKGDTFVKRGRGRPPTGNAKELVSLRLDQDVLAKLRESGPGWQTRVNGLLREALVPMNLGSAANAPVRHTIIARAAAEEAVVAKGVRVVEEIGIRKEVAGRVETVRDSVRETKVDMGDTSATGHLTRTMSLTGRVVLHDE